MAHKFAHDESEQNRVRCETEKPKKPLSVRESMEGLGDPQTIARHKAENNRIRTEMREILNNVFVNIGRGELQQFAQHTMFPVRAYVNCSGDESSAFEIEVDYNHWKDRNISLSLLGITQQEAEEFLQLFLEKRKNG